MPLPRKLTPTQVLERLLRRLEKRMEVLQRVRLEGYEMVICELEVEQDYLRRATRYLEDETPPAPAPRTNSRPDSRTTPRTPRR